jgi:hypothetical protein
VSDANQVEADLEAAAEARGEKQRLEHRLAAARQRVVETEGELRRRRVTLKEEDADVERLESFSPTRIWAGLRGSRADDVARESAERDAARYAVAEAEAWLAAARADHDQLAARLRDLGDVEAAYASALRAKEDWLVRSDSPAASRLADLAAERGQLTVRDRELREAFEAGCRAREHLQHADSLLGSAGSWATWDTFGGGGMLTDMMKYDKLDQASAVLREADQALRAFGRELADVGGAGVPRVQVESMTRTFDVWFDNIFSDMAVRHRISEGAAQVRHALGAVEQTLAAIGGAGREIAARLGELAAERERLLA